MEHLIWVADIGEHRDLYAVDDYSLDCANGFAEAFGGTDDENDFELSFAVDAAGATRVAQPGQAWYMDGTGLGGIIDAFEVTGDRECTYTGRTWAGVLAHRIVMPPSDADNLEVSGDANAVIAAILAATGNASPVAAASGESGAAVASTKVARFDTAWTAIAKVLKASGARPAFSVSQGCNVVIGAEPRDTAETDGETAELAIKRVRTSTNHLVCGGSGQGTSRLVVHLYMDGSGNVSRTQTFTGDAEVAEFYDSVNSDDEDGLVEDGTKALQRLWEADSVEISVEDGGWRLGDAVSAVEGVTGTQVTAIVSKHVYKVGNGAVTEQWSATV